jgi:hypothetical protein
MPIIISSTPLRKIAFASSARNAPVAMELHVLTFSSSPFAAIRITCLCGSVPVALPAPHAGCPSPPQRRCAAGDPGRGDPACFASLNQHLFGVSNFCCALVISILFFRPGPRPIDPMKVARTALQNALSIANLLLTTEALVTE